LSGRRVGEGEGVAAPSLLRLGFCGQATKVEEGEERAQRRIVEADVSGRQRPRIGGNVAGRLALPLAFASPLSGVRPVEGDGHANPTGQDPLRDPPRQAEETGCRSSSWVPAGSHVAGEVPARRGWGRWMGQPRSVPMTATTWVGNLPRRPGCPARPPRRGEWGGVTWLGSTRALDGPHGGWIDFVFSVTRDEGLGQDAAWATKLCGRDIPPDHPAKTADSAVADDGEGTRRALPVQWQKKEKGVVLDLDGNADAADTV
ncbi:hypothetical protein THAOC_11822, partial [Thalassiosira oceanica]